MKMTTEDYANLEKLVNQTLDHKPETMGTIKARYMIPGTKTLTRFVWDLFHAVSDRAQASNAEGYLFLRNLYDRYNDNHIETALKRIVS